MSRDPWLHQSLYLVKCGVPYELAMEMDDAERLAHAVIFAEFEGSGFDWQAMRFTPPKA